MGCAIAIVSKFCLETSPSLRESESVWGRYDPPKFQEISEQKTARNSNSKFEFKPRSGLGGKIPTRDPGRGVNGSDRTGRRCVQALSYKNSDGHEPDNI